MRKLLVISGSFLVVLLGGGYLLVRGARWYQGLASPPPVAPPLGTLRWSPPTGSVPREESEAPLPRQQAAERLRNPVASTPESIERGKSTFGIYCAVCHGEAGHGDGPVSKKFLKPPDLPPLVARRTDGYLYATIRNGGIVMPAHGYRIPPADRWDLVNYLRSIQKSE